MKVVYVLLLCFVGAQCDYKVTLEEVSNVFLPSATNQRRWGMDTAESASYDPLNKYLYVVGGLYRTVIDMSHPNNLAPVGTFLSSHGNIEITDISVCGRYFIQTVDNTGARARGRIEIFKKFQIAVSPDKVFSKEVGECPSAVKFLPDCKTAIVTVNGCAHGRGGDFVDPLGKIILVRLPTDRPTAGGFAENVRVTALNFTLYDNRTDELSTSGARFVYRGNNNNFSNDVDPLNVALSADAKTAYVTLQRTNAMAVIDIATSSIVKVVGLGTKDWSNLLMDASDRDGGINMQRWPVYSYYLPDGVQYMSHGDGDYILTANEGKECDYTDLISWTETKRGQQFVNENITADNVSDEMMKCLSNDTMLGRLKFTTVNGENNTNGFSKFCMFGSRSFSIWDADTLELVWDSGDDIETKTQRFFPDLFNNPVKRSKIIRDDADMESAGMGPEPESVEVGLLQDRLSLVFVGNESPGTILVYSILEDVTKPKFETIWQSVGNTTMTWEEQFNSKSIKGIKPQKLIFLPAVESPTQKPALIVVGDGSSSVTLLNVKLEGKLPPVNGGTEITTNALMLVTALIAHVFAGAV